MTPDISVCICTYRRPHVARTIASVLAQQGLADRSFEILVCDDDPEGSARAAVASAAAQAHRPIRYVRSGAQNVAEARNACLGAATGTWIAFIDDDEIAAPDWLKSLLEVQAAFGADVVKGFVQGRYPGATPHWVLAGDPYTRDYGPDGHRLTKVATGNVLFRRALVEAHGLRFDPAFGRSGGEDTDFFRRCADVGAVMVASRAAVIFEIIPEDRVSSRYLKARYRRMGHTDGRKLRRRAFGGDTVRSLAVAAAALSLLWLHPVLPRLRARWSYAAFRKFHYSFGLAEGVLGRPGEIADSPG